MAVLGQAWTSHTFTDGTSDIYKVPTGHRPVWNLGWMEWGGTLETWEANILCLTQNQEQNSLRT